MEEKKLNELNDETLGAVAGGKRMQFNTETRQYELVDEYGRCVGSYPSEFDAICAGVSVKRPGQ